MENSDCEFYIPVMEKFEMRGDIIILLEQVVEKLEMEKMKQAKNSAKANKEDEANKEQ
jgi:hypothetical protein